MKTKSTETLEQRLSRLRRILEETRATGIVGEALADRLEGDLNRLMNSSWLNCYEFIQARDKSRPDISLALKSAMDYALTADMGLVFLKMWREGKTDEIKQLWPDAPDSIFGEWFSQAPILSLRD